MPGTAVSNPSPVSQNDPVAISIQMICTGLSRKIEIPVASLNARPVRSAITKPRLAARTWSMNFCIVIVKNPSTILDGVEDRYKIVVGQYDIGRLLGDV